MLAKLLSLLANAKGATVATVVTISAATATVGATTPQVQDAVRDAAATLGLTLNTVSQDAREGCGQPEVVAQRNAADKLLRAAYEADHKALMELRGGKDQDNKAVGDIVRSYDDQLRTRLNKALVDVAAQTLGRTGQVRLAEAANAANVQAASTPTAAPLISAATPVTAAGTVGTKPDCTPKPTRSPRPTTGKPEEQGRVSVANRTTLDADLQAIVDTAVEDMDDFVGKAKDEVSKVPAPERGKPENPGNKPETQGSGNRPSPRPTR